MSIINTENNDTISEERPDTENQVSLIRERARLDPIRRQTNAEIMTLNRHKFKCLEGLYENIGKYNNDQLLSDIESYCENYMSKNNKILLDKIRNSKYICLLNVN